jgi:hypothetical protein
MQRRGQVQIRVVPKPPTIDTSESLVEVADRALTGRSRPLVAAALARWAAADPQERAGEQHRYVRLLDLAAGFARPARAVIHLQLAIAADPTDARRYERLARLLERQGAPERAAEWRQRQSERELERIA